MSSSNLSVSSGSIDVQPRDSSRTQASHNSLVKPIRVHTPSSSDRSTPKSQQKDKNDGKRRKKSSDKNKKETNKAVDRPKTVEPVVPSLPDTDSAVGCPFIDFGCDLVEKRSDLRKHIKMTFDDHFEMLRVGVLELRNDIDAFTLYNQRESRLAEDLDYRVMVQLTAKYSSSNLIWRIDNYAQLLKDAKLGRRPIIFSPPFYTGRYGYHLAVSMALHGDGDSKGQYNGVFLTVLKGEYDALLQWPFLCPVTFTLIDQRRDAQREDAVRTLRPTSIKKNRAFIGRPIGERNPSFGVQKFVSLNDMRTRSFVKDDTIFVRVDIDTHDLVPL